MTKKKPLLLSGVFILLSGIVYSQTHKDVPQVMPNTPSVSKLIELIDHSVDYRNGTVATEIPLFEIKLKELTIPIKLVYTSSGFKPNEISEVGLGWSLVAAPTIGRQINGLPDERYYNTSHFKRFSDFTIEDKADMTGYNSTIDGEPDQFFYSLPGRSGSFFVKRDFNNPDIHGFITVPFEPLSINSDESFNRITIDDMDGTQYIFRGREFTQSYINVSTISFETLYSADSIITRFKEVVKFSYDSPISRSYVQKTNGQTGRLELLNRFRVAFPRITVDRFKYVKNDWVATPPTINSPYEYSHYLTKYFLFHDDGISKYMEYFHVRRKRNPYYNILEPMWEEYKGLNISSQNSVRKFCSGISFPDGSVEFTWKEISVNPSKQVVLDKIRIKDLFGNVLRTIILETGIVSNNRPFLNKVTFVGAQGRVDYKYEMEYYPDNGLGLFPVDTYKTNSWGYFDPRGERMRELPKFEPHTFRVNKIYASQANEDSITFSPGYHPTKIPSDFYTRTEDQASIHEMMLRKITDPLKGESIFEYEPAKFFHTGRQQIVYTKAQRIKTITTASMPGGAKTIRRFEYGENGSGLGLPAQELSALDFMTSSIIYDWVYFESAIAAIPSFDCDFERYRVEYRDMPMTDKSISSVSGIVYDRVAEYTSTYGIQEHGKIEYAFDYDNIEGVRDVRVWENRDSGQPILRPFYEKYYRGWKVGQPKYVRYYKFEDNAYSLINSEEYYYAEKYTGDNTMRMYVYPWIKHAYHDHIYYFGNLTEYMLCAGYDVATREHFIDKTNIIRSGNKVLVREVHTDYTEFGNITKAIEYKYNDKMQPSEVKTTLSDGSVLRSTIQYPSDLDGGIYEAMRRVNFINPAIRSDQYNGNKLLYSTNSPYRWENGLIVSDYVETSKGGESMKKEIEFVKYDSKGNIQQITSKGTAKTTYLWGYNNTYPIILIEGMGYAEVYSKLGSLLIHQISSAGSEEAIRALGRQVKELLVNSNALVYVYTYKYLIGVSSITDPRGVVTYFSYDEFNRLSSIMDEDGNPVEEYRYNFSNR